MAKTNFEVIWIVQFIVIVTLAAVMADENTVSKIKSQTHCHTFVC